MRLFDLHFLDFKSIFKQTKNRKPEPAVDTILEKFSFHFIF
jgi:hypothetical protein